MPLVSVHELLLKADQKGYAVGAFNANNMEIVQAIAEAAELEKSPVIMQASQGAISYAGLEYITQMVTIAARQSTVLLVLGRNAPAPNYCGYHPHRSLSICLSNPLVSLFPGFLSSPHF